MHPDSAGQVQPLANCCINKQRSDKLKAETFPDSARDCPSCIPALARLPPNRYLYCTSGYETKYLVTVICLLSEFMQITLENYDHIWAYMTLTILGICPYMVMFPKVTSRSQGKIAQSPKEPFGI